MVLTQCGVATVPANNNFSRKYIIDWLLHCILHPLWGVVALNTKKVNQMKDLFKRYIMDLNYILFLFIYFWELVQFSIKTESRRKQSGLVLV